VSVPDCDYCGAEFDDEDALLGHLAAEHERDLSAIDQRRVEQRETDDSGGVSTGLVVLVVSLVGAVALVGFFLFGGGGGGGPVGNQTTSGEVTSEGNTIVAFDGTAPEDLESRPLPTSGRDDVVGVVSEEPNEQGTSHVSRTALDYDPSNPPTAGPHTNGATAAGFYDQAPEFGPLVHSLEHGAVVVYYDPEAISPEARESLQAFADEHQGTFRSVIVAPHPGEPTAAYELTAWEHRLRLAEYDSRAVRAFLAEYLGRGPENPVR